jgi:hypothetical protein
MHPRIIRENKTVRAMIRIYCRGVHGTVTGLCSECEEIMAYAEKRLNNCPYGEGKTTCAKCPIHCYNPEMRDKILAIMRYSGPKMIYKHPIMTFLHFIDGLRKEPIKRGENV